MLRDDLAGDQVLEGKMVRSVLGMKLEMSAGHLGRGWTEEGAQVLPREAPGKKGSLKP